MKKITKNFISQFLPNNPIIIEAGAHQGRNTIEMSNFWPDAIIHAFEPTEIYEQLVQNTEAYPNIYTYNQALDIVSTSKKMYACIGKYTQLSSLYKPTEYFTKNPKFAFKEITISTITLDKWAEHNKISEIDLIWLDTQGAELNILKGGPEILKKVKLLFLEANMVERYEDAPLYNELKDWLLEHNFQEHITDEEISNNRFNILFKKKA